MKTLKTLTVLVAAALAAGAAQAVTLDTTTAANAIVSVPVPNPGETAAPAAVSGDGLLQNFTSIDWHPNGAALIQGFDLTAASPIGATDTFTLTYQAFASAIGTTSPTPDLRVGSPASAIGTYELTTQATLFETATCLTAGCTTISLAINAGPASTWTIYFDTSPDAVQATGAGFGDGVPILTGTWDSEASVFSSFGPTGVGVATLFGTVTGTNLAYVSPALAGTRFDSTLNFPGQLPPDFTRPTSVLGVPTGTNGTTQFVLQVDASQQFAAAVVPEPATLALFGVGLIGIRTVGRRTKQNEQDEQNG